MFVSSPDKQMEWNDKGIEGSFRFLNRVWRLVESAKVSKSQSVKESNTGNIKELKRKTHETIKRVTEDIEGFRFNTAISAIMELVNTAYSVERLPDGPPAGRAGKAGIVYSKELKEAAETIVILLSLFAPHICEEMWESLGYESGILKAKWPEYDPAVLVLKEVTLIVQINGKVRSRLSLPVDINEVSLKEKVLADPAVRKWIEGKAVRNFIVVPNKLVNIVV